MVIILKYISNTMMKFDFLKTTKIVEKRGAGSESFEDQFQEPYKV